MREKIWNQVNKQILQVIDSKPIRDFCRKTLISLAVSELDPLEQRVELVLKHFISNKDGKTHLKSTEGVLHIRERILLEKLLHHMRNFYIFLSKSDVEEYATCVNLNGSDMFRTKPSLIEAKKSLITSAISVVLRLSENKVASITDDVVATFMRSSYGSKDDKASIDMLKQKALSHARSLLERNNSENTEAMCILHKSLNYISYCEHLSPSLVKCTILWRDQQFSASGKFIGWVY